MAPSTITVVNLFLRRNSQKQDGTNSYRRYSAGPRRGLFASARKLSIGTTSPPISGWMPMVSSNSLTLGLARESPVGSTLLGLTFALDDAPSAKAPTNKVPRPMSIRWPLCHGKCFHYKKAYAHWHPGNILKNKSVISGI